jgi:hypothetical protein
MHLSDSALTPLSIFLILLLSLFFIKKCTTNALSTYWRLLRLLIISYEVLINGDITVFSQLKALTQIEAL